jgi:transglutaminase-like putative cysteine protease
LLSGTNAPKIAANFLRACGDCEDNRGVFLRNLTPIADLPDDALLFLLQSRYCDSDNLADFAWSNFGMMLRGRRRVRAICDFVHAKIRFSYPDARPTRSASDSMHEGIGVCRDFAHLAIALCRCMNIPARYCTG